jgi:hypothetical protein
MNAINDIDADMIRNRKILFSLLLLIAGTYGCGLFSGKPSGGETVFTATEVGTPIGDKVTRDIGPAGGSLASPDGRLTLTVPQNALADTVAFSIQPITNKADGGLGLGYRMEPSGRTFNTPVGIAVRYNDDDLKATVPDALSIAYQDEKGAWHAQKSAKLDPDAKTLSITTAHFTDFAFFARLRIDPTQAKVRVGEGLAIKTIECAEPGFWDRILSRPVVCRPPSNWVGSTWKLRGPGRFTDVGNGVAVYRAPDKKPTPNVAWMDLTIEINKWNTETGETSKIQRTFATEITIVDQGYRVTGQSRDSVLSGVVCDMDKPFTVHAKGSLAEFDFNFAPKSLTASYATTYSMVSEKGSGTYTSMGNSEIGFDIVLNFNATASVLGRSVPAAGGVANIHLTPLEPGEAGCGE